MGGIKEDFEGDFEEYFKGSLRGSREFDSGNWQFVFLFTWDAQTDLCCLYNFSCNVLKKMYFFPETRPLLEV